MVFTPVKSSEVREEEEIICKPPCNTPSEVTSLHDVPEINAVSVSFVHVSEEHVHTPASVSQYDGGPHVLPHASHASAKVFLQTYTSANLASPPNISSNVQPDPGSHLVISCTNEVAPSNIPFIFLTFPTFQPSMP